MLLAALYPHCPGNRLLPACFPKPLLFILLHVLQAVILFFFPFAGYRIILFSFPFAGYRIINLPLGYLTSHQAIIRLCTLQAVKLYYWRRAARIAPAHWVSILLAYLMMLRGRERITVPEASGSLLHYPPESCPRELARDVNPCDGCHPINKCSCMNPSSGAAIETLVQQFTSTTSTMLFCPAGGLWAQAAFVGQWQFGGGCSMQLWSQVTML